MSELDQLLRVSFSNFIITPIKKDTFKESKVSYKLNEPWRGFIESNDFVCDGNIRQSSNLFRA